MDIESLKQHPTTQVKINTIIESDDLRVRYPTLDQGHITRLRRALQAGKTLPPIAVQAGTHKLIFGWHRLYAHRAEYGVAATITAYVLDIDDDQAIRLALAENNAHGLPMRKIDLQQAAKIANEHGLTEREMIEFLNIKPGQMMQLRHMSATMIHRGPEPGQRYAYRRGAEPSGLDMLSKLLAEQAAAGNGNGNGHGGPDLRLAAAAPALPQEMVTVATAEEEDADPILAVHGRFPTPPWLKAFMTRPLAELGLQANGVSEVVLKRPLAHLSGLELTEAQARANRFVSGTPTLSMVRQLVVLVYANALNMQSPTLMASLRDLRVALNTLDLSAAETPDSEPRAEDAVALTENDLEWEEALDVA